MLSKNLPTGYLASSAYSMMHLLTKNRCKQKKYFLDLVDALNCLKGPGMHELMVCENVPANPAGPPFYDCPCFDECGRATRLSQTLHARIGADW